MIKHWTAEKELLLKQAALKTIHESNEEMLRFHREWFIKFDDALHKEDAGPVWLKNTAVAEIVKTSLHALDAEWYKLHAYTVMSNHAHVVLTPHLNEHDLVEKRNDEGKVFFESITPPLSAIMRSIKGTSARESNIILGRTGSFWEAESYDTELKDAESISRAIKYVLRNPVKARIVERWQDHPHTWCSPEVGERLSTD